MLRNNRWLKLLVVVMIQALLLTQVEFSLAAACNSQESYQEAALKFQRMTDKSTSLIIGAGCVQYALSGTLVPHFSLNSLFQLLAGSSDCIVKVISGEKRCTITNGFYKVFTSPVVRITMGYEVQGIVSCAQGMMAARIMVRSGETRAPPAVCNIGVKQTKPNC